MRINIYDTTELLMMFEREDVPTLLAKFDTLGVVFRTALRTRATLSSKREDAIDSPYYSK